MKRVLVANRGEIAVRIIRAAHDLGIEAVAVYSTADAEAPHVRMADAAVEIGPPPAGKSYLDIGAIVEAARSSEAEAVHPGYGFLAERADFASAVEDAGLRFVGPKPEHIALMGDKARAREAAEDGGVPTIPGSDGAVADAGEAREVADEIGYPVALKAAGGGGGRGIRIVHDPAELEGQYKTASREAAGAFDDARIYVERFVTPARHVEVQVLGDGERAIHLYERECSLQRRRQKVVEETPAPGLADATRAGLHEAAVSLCHAVGYRSAGTVEFLVDAESGEFFFIEMNTRIQVEHPVTEVTTGVDLVAEQLRIAAGEGLRLDQDDVVARGCALELRINAEDPANKLPAEPRAARPHRPARRAVGPRRHVDGAGRRGPAVLRLAAGQGDRVGPRPADRAGAGAAGAARARGRRREDHDPAARRAARRGLVRRGRVRHRHARGVAGERRSAAA